MSKLRFKQGHTQRKIVSKSTKQVFLRRKDFGFLVAGENKGLKGTTST